MTRKKSRTPDAADLRRRAEERLKERKTEEAIPRSDEDSRRLVHELEVHQIELEMQNEELQGARAEAEAGLERYTDLYDFAPVAYLTLDSDGTIRKANLTAARMLGRDRSQLVGGRLGHFVSAEHRFSFDAFLKKVFASQTKEVCELALGTDPSSSSWVHIEAAVSENGGRECRAALVDVTERRRMDEAVRFRMESIDFAVEHSLAEVLQKAMDAIGALTDSPIGFYHFVDADQQTLLLQAWSTRTVSEFYAAEGHGRRFPMDKAKAWADCVRQRRPVIRNGSPLSHREELPGGPAAVDRELVVPIMRSDRIVAIVGVGNRPTDYTDQDVAVVSHLADVAWVIVERVMAERAREESDRRYREAAEALREVDRNRTQFLAMLSHELRNPLAPIKSSLFILDRSVPGGDQAKRAQAVIDRQVGQLSRLVDDLLDTTRISSGKVHLKLERIDLNEVVRRTVEDHRPLFEKNGVHLDVTPAEGPLIVKADWGRIAQIIGNLLNNATKFTGRGGSARVSVARDEGTRQATVRVVDTGTGMSPEVLSRVFERFTQADTTLDRSKGGLGLGLALVKGLVELHCGEVSANSEGPGRGSEFIVRLPLDPVQVEAKTEVAAAAERHARRVLVIEDNVDAADSLGEALELSDHEVEIAYAGLEGLQKARQFKPDVVFCDIGLPGMDGYEVARAFRSDEVLKGTFLVALSGYALPEDLECSANAGFDRHLAKPPSLEILGELLVEAPQRPTGTPAAPKQSPSDLMH